MMILSVSMLVGRVNGEKKKKKVLHHVALQHRLRGEKIFKSKRKLADMTNVFAFFM